MTYPHEDEMVVERVEKENEDKFYTYVNHLIENSTDKNYDWFPDIIKHRGSNKKYSRWYITLHNNTIIAFSCVMEINGMYRLISRLYNGLRKTGLENPVKENEISPAMLMLEKQLEDFPSDNCFISMEYLNRRPLLKKLAPKINKLFYGDWKFNEDVYQVCSNAEDFSCWQSTISEKSLPFKSITVEEYLKRFGRKKKASNERK